MKTRNSWLAAAVLAAAVPPAMAQQQINKRVNVAPDATVEVSNVQGSVTITTWDKNEVELVAELESDEGRAGVRGHGTQRAHRGRAAERQVRPRRRGRRLPDAARAEPRAAHRGHGERGDRRHRRARRAEPRVRERRGPHPGIRRAGPGDLRVGRRHRDGQRRQGGRDDRERERHVHRDRHPRQLPRRSGERGDQRRGRRGPAAGAEFRLRRHQPAGRADAQPPASRWAR